MAVDERRSRADWLAELGVPAPFHDAIIDAPKDRTTAVSGNPLMILAALAVLIGIGMAAFLGLDGYVRMRAAGLAEETGATLTYVNVGIGPLILMFGLILLGGWTGGVLAGRSWHAAAAMINKPPPPGLARNATRWIIAGSIRRAASRGAPVDGFLRGMVKDYTRRWGIGAATLLVPALLMTVLETNSFWVAGPSGIVEHRMLPPFTSRRYELKEVTGLTTGCNNTEKSNRLIYQVQLASGGTFGVGDAKVVNGRGIEAIEEIDARIDRGVEHRRWSHLDRNPVHPACLGYWASQFDKDGLARLIRLLRLTPGELRGSH
jgi:hypothetical protein